jgi:DNA-binding NarL/FixJ family response regulator
VDEQSRKRGRVLLAEDDDGFRVLVAEALRAAGYEVAEAATGAEALASADRARPDLALLDVVLPGMSGYELFRQLRERFGEDMPIMFMSGDRIAPYDHLAGLALGASEYLDKPFELEELLALLRANRKGHDTSDPARLPRAKLTSRQLEVLEMLADGLHQNEIAARLVISPKTVGAHVEHIFVKLGVHSQAHAVARGYRDRLLGTA